MALTDKLTAIANAIRGKTGKTEALTLDQMATEIDGIETGGGENQLDYSRSAGDYRYSVLAENFVVKFGAKTTGEGGSYLYSVGQYGYATGCKTITIILEKQLGLYLNLASAFANSRVVEKIDLTGIQPLVINSLNNAFPNCFKLKEICGEMDVSLCQSGNQMASAFKSCSVLEKIKFKSGTIAWSISFADCSALSGESIQSIIDGLADFTGGTAQTLTLHATVGAKLTDEQKATVTAKNWTVTY